MERNTHDFQTIRLQAHRATLRIQIFRPEADNSINNRLIREMLSVLEEAELDTKLKAIVIEGSKEYFCTGMDFKAVNELNPGTGAVIDPNSYYNLLNHFSGCSKVMIAKVEGKVNAGGIGLVSACDLVIADERATFGLSEALFGLLPACVMPFLVRRIGYQKAQWMTLITQGITARRAFEIGLVDELSTNVNDTLRRNLLRLNRLETHTIKGLKNYMSKLWIMNESTQRLAVETISALINSEQVQDNIRNFVQNGKFPWEK